ncbi:uncharacterized protein LOC108666872 [Hyalella azteca]|uniref:Uncharacterized protein LOC108666872 n=1 Tax=Hyalella azteca TaxID=294128 RepID=A0A8B7N7P0_HYAAZ|nr:uncharacterized protein LOC108666872 [Hyalella azteca]
MRASIIILLLAVSAVLAAENFSQDVLPSHDLTDLLDDGGARQRRADAGELSGVEEEGGRYIRSLDTVAYKGRSALKSKGRVLRTKGKGLRNLKGGYGGGGKGKGGGYSRRRRSSELVEDQDAASPHDIVKRFANPDHGYHKSSYKPAPHHKATATGSQVFNLGLSKGKPKHYGH